MTDMTDDILLEDAVPVSSNKSKKRKWVLMILLMMSAGLLWRATYSKFEDVPSGAPATSSALVKPTTPMASPAMPASASGPQGSWPYPDPKPALVALPEDTKSPEDQQFEDNYIKLLNDIQMQRAKHDLADENKSISASDKDRVKNLKEAETILNGKSSQQQASAQSQVPGAPPPPPVVVYTLASVAQVHGQWSAVLSYQGKTYNVSEGDTLSPDGSKVTSITRNKVELDNNGNKTTLNISAI